MLAQKFQVKSILFVSSPYHLPGLKAELPPTPWKITHAISMDQAAAQLHQTNFNLAFIDAQVLGDNPGTAIPHLRTLCPGLPVILLVPPDRYNPWWEGQNADHLFIWSGEPDLFCAMVRFIEDRLCNDPARRAVLLVEDSIEYTSFFLTKAYRELDAAFPGPQGPKLVLAGDHETAIKRFRQLGNRLHAVLCDTRLPWRGKVAPGAGIDILSTVHREMSGLPIMLMSAEEENKTRAESIPAPFLNKHSNRLDQDLRDFFHSLSSVPRHPDGFPVPKHSTRFKKARA